MLNQQITEDISTACHLEDEMAELKSHILLLNHFTPSCDIFRKYKSGGIKSAVLSYAICLRRYRKIMLGYSFCD